MVKEVEIKIDAFGDTTAEARGFNGVGCTDATSFLSALGGELSVNHKPEYFGTDAVVECVRS